jgi:hypothetical protein
MASVTVPGKLFLIGEYSVLQGGPALLAAIKPGYRFENRRAPETWIHPESPLGKYQQETGNKILIEKTAELIAGAMMDLERIPESKRIWAWYREFFPKASGADLVVQLEALRTKASLFEFEKGSAGLLAPSSLGQHIQVFQINPKQKLATHEALNTDLSKLDEKKLTSLVKIARSAFESEDIQALGCLNDFADSLAKSGLETRFAHEARIAFSGVAGVTAVKGCGAGMHDAYLVVGEALSPASHIELNKVAESFGLNALGSLQEILW